MESIIALNRKKELWRLLSNMPITVGEAFRPKTIKDSWRKCGFSPLDTITILSKCSLWHGSDTFSAAQKRFLIDNIPLLFPFVELRGRVSDLEMETLFPFLPPLEKTPKYDLSQLAVNRDRCCIVSHPGFFAGRAEAVALALANNPSLKPKAPPKPKKVVQEYTAFTALLGDKFNADDIKYQLEIRGVTIGPHCKKKASFVALWEEHSARPDLRPVPASAAPAAPTAPAAPVLLHQEVTWINPNLASIPGGASDFRPAEAQRVPVLSVLLPRSARARGGGGVAQYEYVPPAGFII
jgi:hypothetical protein